jgi:hypothetical protein
MIAKKISLVGRLGFGNGFHIPGFNGLGTAYWCTIPVTTIIFRLTAARADSDNCSKRSTKGLAVTADFLRNRAHDTSSASGSIFLSFLPMARMGHPGNLEESKNFARGQHFTKILRGGFQKI